MDYTEDFQVFWAKYPKRWNRELGFPKEMIENLLKKVPDIIVNVNNERNRQMAALKDK